MTLGATGPALQEGLAQTSVALVAVLVVWWLLVRLGRRFVERLVRREAEGSTARGDERAQRIQTLAAVAQIFLGILMFAAFLLLAMSIWGIPITPFLAVGSVIGIAVGFGAQDLVKDVIAGIFIIIEDQYGIGDVVQVAGVSGQVEAIRLRTTVLRDLDGNVHHVPNGQITVATNFTDDFAQVVIDAGVSYDTDIDKALAVMESEVTNFHEDPEWAERFLDAPEMFGVQELGDSAVTLRMAFKVHPEHRWVARREILRRLKLRFDKEGIEIPYPHVTVVRKSE